MGSPEEGCFTSGGGECRPGVEGQGNLRMQSHLGWLLKDDGGFHVPVVLQRSVMFQVVCLGEDKCSIPVDVC